MIPRYSRPEMSSLWGEERKQQIWLDVELLALEAMEKEGLVPEGTHASVKAGAKINPERALAIEEEVKHDVIAFLTSISESAGPDARFLHRGMTSNDLLDTSFGVQLKEAGHRILAGIDSLLEVIEKRANEFKYTPCIGRSHGIHAEPISFGVKIASWYAEVVRRRDAIARAVELVATGKIAGAVGTYASVHPAVESHVMSNLGLQAETVPTQVVHRDRHAEFFTSLALLGSSVERICVEIRHMQRTEVGEAEEGFSKGQKGSSAMPHKKNPIATENLTGVARLLRGYAISAMENVALWHERDISHSSVERVIAPDATIITDYMLHRLRSVIQNLVVYPERMQQNLDLTKGLVFSGTLLIVLADKGMSREAAYALVQKHALAAWQGGESFKERMSNDPEVTKYLNSEDIEDAFGMRRHLAHVDTIFARTFRK